MNQFVPPKYLADAFNCPHCNAYAVQEWITSPWIRGSTKRTVKDVAISLCSRCGEASVWIEGKDNRQPLPDRLSPLTGVIPTVATEGALVYPYQITTPLPTKDMPDNVQQDFLEARLIVDKSPRGAAALLRLGVEKLLHHLVEGNRNVNDAIKFLVSKGLPAEIQQALDTVRVIGNDAVHPGTMDLRDNVETATALFGLLNYIVDRMISEPKRIAELYNSLPQSKRDAIDSRDGNKTSS